MPRSRNPLGGDDGYFAVEVCRLELEDREDSGNGSEARRPVVAGAGEHLDVAGLDPGGGSVAVELHLMHPGVALRRALHQEGALG